MVIPSVVNRLHDEETKIDRWWLLTWTTYGTWLPGDARGFVGRVRDAPGPRVEHDEPGTPYDRGLGGLQRASRERMKGASVWLTIEQAEVVAEQLRETAAHRQWSVQALSVMTNHVHVVVCVPGDTNPETLLRDFKSYASRALNSRWSRPASGTWWTQSGSMRPKKAVAIPHTVDYVVRRQHRPLVVWEASANREDTAG